MSLFGSIIFAQICSWNISWLQFCCCCILAARKLQVRKQPLFTIFPWKNDFLWDLLSSMDNPAPAPQQWLTEADSRGCFNIYSRETREPLKSAFCQLNCQRTMFREVLVWKLSWNYESETLYVQYVQIPVLYIFHLTLQYTISVPWYLSCLCLLLHQTAVKVK